MKWSIAKLSLLTSLAIAAALPAGQAEQEHERNTADNALELSQCAKLINTHVVFNNMTGESDCTIIEGMGPGSAWYEKHVAPFDPYEAGEDASYKVDGRDLDDPTNLAKRQTPPIIYHMSRGRATTHYGYITLTNAVEGVLEKCGRFDCQSANGGTTRTFPNVPYIVKCSGATQVGTKQVHGNLVVTAGAIFPSKRNDASESLKGNFKAAMVKIANKIHTHKVNQYWHYCNQRPTGETINCEDGTQNNNYFGSRYFYIQRQIRTAHGYAESGHVKITASMYQYENTVCENIVNALAQLASAADPTGIASIANGYFGKYIAKDACA